jgi:hypothetical protein
MISLLILLRFSEVMQIFALTLRGPYVACKRFNWSPDFSHRSRKACPNASTNCTISLGEICQWVGFGIINLREPLDHLRCRRAIEFASVANILELGGLTNMVSNLEAFVNRRSVSVRINDPVAVY